MKQCDSCGKENRDTSVYCSECGGELAREPAGETASGTHGRRRAAIVYAVAGVIAAGLIAGSIVLVVAAGGSPPRRDPVRTAEDLFDKAMNELEGLSGEASSSESHREHDVPLQAGSVGSPVEAGDLDLTVLSSVRTRVQGKDDLAKGNELLVVEIRLENTGEDEALVSSILQMFVVDEKGNRYDAGFYDPGSRFQDGQLDAGGVASGNVAFEVPKDARELYFVFETDITGGGREAAVRL